MVWSAALVCMVVAGVTTAFAPQLIARIPEPDPTEAELPEPDPTEPEQSEPQPEQPKQSGQSSRSGEPKEAYAAIAASPGLRWRAALAGAVVGGLVGGVTGWDWSLLFLGYLVPVGVALAVVDWRTRLLPTWVIAPSYAVLVVLVLIAGALSGDWHAVLRSVEGWAAFGGLYFVLWFIYPAGLGYGDVRLSGLLGIALGYLGWGEVIVGAWSGFVLGGLGGLVLAALKLVDRKANPFGPWMLVAAVVAVLLGPALSDHLATAYG